MYKVIIQYREEAEEMAKFAPTEQTVESVISNLKSRNKQSDAWQLVQLFQEISQLEPVVWHPGIIGFGLYQYRTKSGIQGDAPLLAFAPRQDKISLYIDQDLPEREVMLRQLGKHKLSVGCVYVNKLKDVNIEILRELVERLFVYTQQRVRNE